MTSNNVLDFDHYSFNALIADKSSTFIGQFGEARTEEDNTWYNENGFTNYKVQVPQ
jgi:hypothetical protein